MIHASGTSSGDRWLGLILALQQNTPCPWGPKPIENTVLTYPAWKKLKKSQLFSGFIHPWLDHILSMHASPVWNPYKSKDITTLENVQICGCKMCTKQWPGHWLWSSTSASWPSNISTQEILFMISLVCKLNNGYGLKLLSRYACYVLRV